MKTVPVLVTFDVDPAPDVSEGVRKALELLQATGIQATFFFTALEADAPTVKQVLSSGHEVGCHGLSHDEAEEFNTLPEADQRGILSRATTRLQQLAEKPVLSFRAPRVKISSATLRILEELGYLADSSVCSQRLDFVSSNLVNPGWLWAPRLPYHPSDRSPYRRGSLKILEVPVSAILIPFVSTTLRIFGVAFMKLLFTLLYWESRLTGKPIVYLVHPHEFLYAQKKPFHWRMLVPDRSWRVYGFPIRIWLARRHLGPEILKRHRLFFEWIGRRKGVRFTTTAFFTSSKGESGSHEFETKNGRNRAM